MGKAVDPPLRVREDWWVFEKKLKGKGGLVGFRKNPSLRLKEKLVGFRKTLRLREKLAGFRKKSKNWWFFEKNRKKNI